MKPPKDCSTECKYWFAHTARSQRESIRLDRAYPHHGFKSELKRRYLIRLSMLRNPSF